MKKNYYKRGIGYVFPNAKFYEKLGISKKEESVIITAIQTIAMAIMFYILLVLTFSL
jgi:hypothetical protein